MRAGIKKSRTVPPSRPGRSHFLRNLGWITLGALALRLIVSFELAAANHGINSVLRPSKLTDLATYLRLSEEISRGIFPEEFYYQPFYYAVFLPLLRLFSGGNPAWIILIAQSLLGAGTVWLCGLIGARLWSRRAGLLAAGMTAISTPLLLYTPFAQNETLQAFLLTLLFYLCLRAMRTGKWRDWCGVGVTAGAAILTRGNALLFLPVIVVVQIWNCRRHAGSFRAAGKPLALSLAVLLIGCWAIQLPFIVYNSHARGTLTGPSTAADAVLALGNTPEAPPGGRNPGLPAGPMEYPETYADFMARAANRSVALQMWDFLCREPGAFLELQGRKLLLFWDSREIPNNVSLYGEGNQSMLLRLLLPGRSAVLLPLILAGMLWLPAAAVRRRRITWWLLYGFVIIYWGATALFYILSRFRAPILPLGLIFAGIFLDRALRRYRAGGRQALYRGAVPALLAGIFIAVPAYDLYRTSAESTVHRLVRPDGIVASLLSGKTLRLDHGPFTFGDWNTYALHPGAVLIKKFSAMPDQCEAELEISFLIPETPAAVTGRINGVPLYHVFRNPGIEKVRLRLPVSHGEIRFSVDSVQGTPALLYDRQRCYGRSGAPDAMNGEWIMRLYY